MNKSKNLLALVGIVVLLLSLSVPMMQCAPAAEEEITPPAEEGEVKYGGRLDVGMTSSISTTGLGEPFDWTPMGCLFQILVYDTLSNYAKLEEGTGMDWWPRLCQSYEVDENDHKIWTLHFVENATWHDGMPVTAEDVEFSIRYWWHPVYPSIWSDFESMEVIDDYTLRMVMQQPLPPFPPPGDTWPVWGIVPKHIFEPYKDDVTLYANEEAIGSGPYKLKEFTPDEYLWLEANEDYWGGRPYLDEVVFHVYGNIEAAIMALKSGEIDAFVEDGGVPPVTVEDLRAHPDIEVLKCPGNIHRVLGCNLHNDTPLRDLKVRKAIAHGINYDRIIDMVFLGYAERCDSFYFTDDAFHNPNLPKYDYDPGKANELLDEAGFTEFDGNGIRYNPATGEDLALELLVPDSVTYVKQATILVEDLADIGVGMDMKTVDGDTFIAFVSHPEDDAYEISTEGTFPAPTPYGDWIWRRCLSPGAPGNGHLWNEPDYRNPIFDELYLSYMSETDVAKKKEKAYGLQRIIAEDLPWIFICAPDYMFAYRPEKFEGWVIEPGGGSTWFNGWSYYELHLK